VKVRIIIDIESDRPLNLWSQRLKENAENAVIEVLSKTKANTFVNATIGRIDKHK
jgi:hypothetical protein